MSLLKPKYSPRTLSSGMQITRLLIIVGIVVAAVFVHIGYSHDAGTRNNSSIGIAIPVSAGLIVLVIDYAVWIPIIKKIQSGE